MAKIKSKYGVKAQVLFVSSIKLIGRALCKVTPAMPTRGLSPEGIIQSRNITECVGKYTHLGLGCMPKIAYSPLSTYTHRRSTRSEW